MLTLQTTETTENKELSANPVRTVAKQSTSEVDAILEPM